MARKQDAKVRAEKSERDIKPVKAAPRKKTAAAEVAPKRGRKNAPVETTHVESGPIATLKAVAEPVARTTAKTKKAIKDATDSALSFVPEVHAPKLPAAPSLHTDDVVRTAKDIGGQVMAVLNTDVGRVIAAEVLIYLAKSLTKAAAQTEAGQDAKEAVLNAGARIGAAVASAGAKAMEGGAQAAGASVEAASGAAVAAKDVAVGAKDVARDVAQVAVAAVGGAVLDAAQKMIKRRKSQNDPSPASSRPDGEKTATA